MRSVVINKSEDQTHWVVKVLDNGQVVKITSVSGTHEEAVVVAESYLSESTSSPVFLKE